VPVVSVDADAVADDDDGDDDIESVGIAVLGGFDELEP